MGSTSLGGGLNILQGKEGTDRVHLVLKIQPGGWDLGDNILPAGSGLVGCGTHLVHVLGKPNRVLVSGRNA